MIGDDTRIIQELSRIVPVIHAVFSFYRCAFTVASKLAASATFSIVAVLSMRFMKPLRAVPGPSSMNRV